MTAPTDKHNYEAFFDEKIKEIIKKLSEYYPHYSPAVAERITKAFDFGKQAHEAQTRFSGEPYFTHPVEACLILLNIQPDVDTVIACLLHDVIEDTPITADQVEQEFGSRVKFLCEGVEKVAKVRMKGREREAESLRKLFIAMAQDLSVVLIKLADRIHNLETMEYVRPEKQKRIAEESLKIYSPVAQKLNLYYFKNRIEDASFKITNSEGYESIREQVDLQQKERQAFIGSAIETLEKTLLDEGIPFKNISGRPKHFYSIHDKLNRKNLSQVQDIYDLFALRIITENEGDCYRALGAIHKHWKPIPNRFKDYIAVPKPNGYQSLHTTVLGLMKSDIPTEVQIKTEPMHLDAEFGPAAHWAYKSQNSTSNFNQSYLDRLEWLPNAINGNDDLNSEQFFENLSASLSRGRIHVMTPRGDIKNLPEKATPIDFAYSVHTDIGNSIVSAKVNGVIKPLNYELKTGDVIEVITKKGRQPNPLWLKVVQSNSAKNHIRSFLNRHKEDEELDMSGVQEKSEPIKKTKTRARSAIKPTKPTGPLVIGGEKDIPYRLSPCCKPKPGQLVIAYISRGLEFNIHKIDCKQLEKLEPERFIEAEFLIPFQFSLVAEERVGVLKDLSEIIAEHGINMIESNFFLDKEEGLAHWKFTVEGSSEQQVHQLLNALKKVPNVKAVTAL